MQAMPVRSVHSIEEEGDLYSRCWRMYELCGFDLIRPLTDNQIPAILTLPLTLSRPSEPEPIRSRVRYRLYTTCRSRVSEPIRCRC